MNQFDELECIDPDNNYFQSSEFYLPNSSKYVTLNEYFQIPKDFTIINYNIRSFRANFDLFSTSFETFSQFPEILVLTETWFTNSYTESIAGFDEYHVVRSSNRSGGVSVYVKSDSKSRNIQNFSTSLITQKH